MGRGSGGGGRSGSGGGSTGLLANATGGVNRTIAGKRVNTAEAVNAAIASANKQTLDLDTARTRLASLGNRNAPDAVVRDYARQSAVLQQLQRITGANTTGQLGKWDFASAQTIHNAFNSYLGRRIQGQRSRYTAEGERRAYQRALR